MKLLTTINYVIKGESVFMTITRSFFMRMFMLSLLGIIGLQLQEVQAQPQTKVFKGWEEIAVGSTHSLGIKKDGTVWQWGNTTVYRGDEGSETNLSTLVPEQVPDLQDVVSVAGGQTHSLALRSDGTVWAWGGNYDGELGDGTKISRGAPRIVDGLSDVVAIEADWTRSFAVKEDGTVWGWGGFYYRDVDGTVHNPDIPAKLNGFKDIVSISSGYGNFVALKKDGTVWYYSDELTQVSGLNNIVQVAVGAEYSYGLKSDGTVWTWGSGGVGMVNGISVADESASRILVGVKDVISIQASAGGPLMLKKDGTVWTSGVNAGGQLGIGSYKSSDVPVQVIGLKKITSIAAHGIGFRSMAIRADGTLWSWGIAYTGDGTKNNRTTPVGIRSYETEVMEIDPFFVEVDGTILQFDQPPVSVKNRTLVPLRAIFEAMGAELQWNSITSTITATKGDVTIVLIVGNSTALLNGKKINLDAPSTIMKGNTLVPVLFISESLGAKVYWDESNKTISIKTGDNN
jgi:alpha-tubulin suppressor-like RCC1 family protein